MTQTETRQLALQLMRQHGLHDWAFAFNHARRNLGICRYDTKRIELSRHFVQANDQAAIRDTILHEIAHALAGHRAGHGPKWKAICRQIGAKPQRLDREATMPAGRWQAICPGCKQVMHRHRRPMRGRVYVCRRCGSKRGKLIWRQCELGESKIDQ